MSAIRQMDDVSYHCIVIGGGPAGLTAAIYLARYHLDVIVIDKGGSRAATIPLSRNLSGFPEGIGGLDLLTRMRTQAERYGARVREGNVGTIEKRGNDFSIRTDAGETVTARTVLMATGVFNRRPAMPEAMHDDAVARSLLRYCPICDAYEITDKRVAVIGTGDRGVNEAMFLRSFTKDVTLISPALEHEMTATHIARLTTYGIAIVDGPAECIDVHDEAISVGTSKGSMAFAAVYPALGSDIHSELAALLGAKRTDDGCILVDCHQRASVPGLYAAGDVVLGLDQMGNAMGQAGVAATSIRNDLCDKAPLLR
jgi:thioredoxin reductase (NADPH)